MKKLIFPLAPGLIYEQKSYINPDINSLFSFIENKDFLLCCYGGVVETFFSLIYLEYLSLKFKDKKYYWIGNSIFSSMIRSNGLARVLNAQINKEHITKANIPFLSSEDEKYCIINPLYTYLKKQKKGRKIKDIRNFLAQLNNAFIKNVKEYFPLFRDKRIPESYSKWKVANKVIDENNIIMIFPDRTGWSMHSENFLEWTPSDLRSFTSMMYGKGYKIYIVTNKQSLYYGLSNAKILPLDFDLVFYLLQKSKYIISNEVDWIYIGALVSKAPIYCRYINKGAFGIYKTMSYIGIDPYKRVETIITPIDVFNNLLRK